MQIKVAIILISIFFAFFHLDKQYGFEFDQERDYNIVRSIVTEGKLTLIGPRVVSSAGFYLGPWYYYLNIPFYLLFNGEPSFAAYLTGFVNIVTCLLIYFVLHNETKSRLMSSLAAILWMSSANRSSWNVSFVPLFFLCFIHFYFNLVRKWHFSSFILLTLTFSFALHFHPQMIFLSPLWLYILYRHRITPKQFPLLLISFLIPIVPLIFFDLRHDFVNITAAMRFFSQASSASAVTDKFRFGYSLRQFSTALMPLHPAFQHNLKLTAVILSLTIIFGLFYRHYLGLIVVTLLSILVLSFYNEPTWPEYYHYLAGFSILLLVFIAGSYFKPAKWFLLVVSLLVIWSNYTYLKQFVNPGSYYYKKSMILYMLQQNGGYGKLNIENDFRYGEGLGFLPIREYYEEKNGGYNPDLKFYVSYASSPKHNQSKETFGLYAVSKVEKGK